jgi:hypothetical protein
MPQRLVDLGDDEASPAARAGVLLDHPRQESDPSPVRTWQDVHRVQIAQRVEDRRHRVVELRLGQPVGAHAPEQLFQLELRIHAVQRALERQVHVALAQEHHGVLDDRRHLLRRQLAPAELEFAQGCDRSEEVFRLTCASHRGDALRPGERSQR